MAQDKFSFNHSLKRLEEITKLLENPDLDLEEALKLLEEGVSLHKICNDKLNQYQIRIKEILKEDSKNQINTKVLQNA